MNRPPSLLARVVRCPDCGQRGALDILFADERDIRAELAGGVIACQYCTRRGAAVQPEPSPPEFPRPRGALHLA